MNETTFTYLLEHPETITANQTMELRSLIDEFPYFQSAHALYLKGLKNQGSFTYNKALKITAAHTTNRDVLFDYITSSQFYQNEISSQIKHQEKHLSGIKVNGAEDMSVKVQEEELQKAEDILNPNLFVAKKDSKMTSHTPEELLEVGKPLEFYTQETYSFSEWLKLAAFKPIQRDIPIVAQEKKRAVVPENKADTNTLSRKRKEQIINSFIETNPKIRVSPSEKVGKTTTLIQTEHMPPESLMTETLARVYLEQKNYKKARIAYRILSLKYPEKSGFFADQIRAIQELEEN